MRDNKVIVNNWELRSSQIDIHTHTLCVLTSCNKIVYYFAVPVVEFVDTEYTVFESDKIVDVCVTTDIATEVPFTIGISTTDGTAEGK